MPDKKPLSFTFGRCKASVVTGENGKKHIELECKTKGDRDEAAAVFEEEVILRVNPTVILEGSSEEKLPVTGDPKTIQGKTELPGYRYLEHLDLSVKE